MKKIMTLLLTAALIMSFYGCRGGRDEISGDEASTDTGAENEEKAALDEVRQSDLACPARTVALTEEAAKLWLLAGGELCAVCDCENVIPGLKGNEKKVGKKGRVTAEEVLQLSPDYVLCDDSLANAEEIREALSKSGIRCEDITITSFDDYFSTVKNFCMMTKNADAYEKAALNVRGRRTAIMRNAAGEMPDLLLSLGMEETMESRPSGTESGRDPKAEGAGRVGFELIRVSSDGAEIASNNDWVCSMLEDLGLVNLCTGEESVTFRWKKAEESVTASSAVTDASPSQSPSGAAVSEREGASGTSEAESEISGTAETEIGTSGTSEAESGTSGTAEAESGTSGTSEAESGTSGDSETDGGNSASSGAETAEAGKQSSSESEVQAAKKDGETSSAQENGTSEKTGEAAAEKEREAFEKELQKNPDFIFVIYCDNEKHGKKNLEELTGALKGWKNMKAVKFNHMITLPKDSFCSLPNDAWDLPMEYLYQSIFLMG